MSKENESIKLFSGYKAAIWKKLLSSFSLNQAQTQNGKGKVLLLGQTHTWNGGIKSWWMQKWQFPHCSYSANSSVLHSVQLCYFHYLAFCRCATINLIMHSSQNESYNDTSKMKIASVYHFHPFFIYSMSLLIFPHALFCPILCKKIQ